MKLLYQNKFIIIISRECNYNIEQNIYLPIPINCPTLEKLDTPIKFCAKLIL